MAPFKAPQQDEGETPFHTWDCNMRRRKFGREAAASSHIRWRPDPTAPRRVSGAKQSRSLPGPAASFRAFVRPVRRDRVLNPE